MVDSEVERIADLMREAHHEVATAWLDTLTDSPPTPSECWAAVARAVIADRAAQHNRGTTHWAGCWDAGPRHYACLRAHLGETECRLAELAAMQAQPPVTGGPTLMEVARERDALRHLLDDAKTEAGMQEAWANDLQAALCAAVEWMAEDGCDCGTDEPGSCALCVARAVIADRVVREPVPQDAPNKQRAWLIERLREEDAKLRAINLRLTAERDAARAKLGVVNARLYAVEAERDALQRRLDALATREPTTEELRWLHSVTGGNNALHSVTGGNNALDAWRFVRDALLAEPSRPTEDRS